MDVINNIAASVGYFAIAIFLTWVMLCMMEWLFATVEQLRYKKIEARFLQQLSEIDRYCCSEFPDVACAMQMIIEYWRDGLRVDAALLRKRLGQNREGK